MRHLIALLVFAVTGAGARVIRVPADQPTVQQGLNSAQPGDTVLVAPGTYRERLVWPGRDSIRLISEQGPELTILRPRDDSGRVLLLPSAAITNATLIRGFTITGGRLVATLTAPGYGAGIRLVYAGPEISHNHIVGNRVEAPGGIGSVANAEGAGLSIYTTDNVPLVHRNLIAYNTIIHDRTQTGFARGAGASCRGPGVFYQNEFRENSSRTVGIVPVPAVTAYGGGLCLEGGPSVVYSNLFIGNRAGGYDLAGAHAYGGGLYVNDPGAYIANNTFVGNIAEQAHGWGGGICIRDSLSPVVKNNIVVGNIAAGAYPWGGGICFRGDTTQGIPTYDHNNVWANTPEDYYAALPGPHALNADPLFATGPAGSHYLSAIRAGQPYDSPCIDAGDTLLMTVPLNLDSLRRTWTTSTDSAPDRFAPDMGYLYPIDRPTGLASTPGRPMPGPRLTIAPNPVGEGGATLRVEGVEASRLKVTVYDVSGREVLRQSAVGSRTGLLLAGLGALPDGTYFIRVAAGGFVSTRKLTVFASGEQR